MLTTVTPSLLYATNESLAVDYFELLDENKQPIPNGSEVSMDDSFHIGFVYTLENVADIDESIEYTIPLPTNLVWAKDKIGDSAIPIRLKYTASNDVLKEANLGNVTFKDDNLVLQYSSGIRQTLMDDGLSDIELDVRDINLFCKLDKDAIQDAKNVEIILSDSDKISFQVKENQDVLPSVKDKKVTYQDGVLKWTVTIAPGKPNYQNIEFKDVLSDNQIFVENSFAVDTTSQTAQISSNTLTYTIPSITTNDIVITYHTKPKNSLWYDGTTMNDMKGTFTNTAKLFHNGNEISSKEASIEATGSWMSKTGQKIEGKNAILWTLTINASKETLKNITVYDVLTNGDSYLEMPDKLENKANNSEISFTKGFTYNETTYDANKALTFQLATLSEEMVITYETPIKKSYFEFNNTSLEFKNKAWMTTDWNPNGDSYSTFTLASGSIKEGKVSVPTSLIKKTAGEYNPSTQEITWNISINTNKIDVMSAVFKDTVPENQEIIGYTGFDAFAIKTTITSDKKSISYDFGDIGVNEHTFTITTKVIDKKFIASNQKLNLKNSAILDYKLRSDSSETHTATSDATKEISSKMLSKKGGNYDYSNHQQTWELTVNENAMIVKDVILEDTIPTYQTLDTSNIILDGTTTLDTDSTKASYYEVNGSILRIYMSDSIASGNREINRKHIISYKTRVNTQTYADFKTEKKVDVENSAILHLDHNTYPDVKVDASKSIDNSLLQKSSNTSDVNTSGVVHYSIGINPNKAILTHNEIIDTMSFGLQLDYDSVKLYKAVVKSNGKMSKGSSVDSNIYSYQYATKGNERILTITFQNVIDDAYILEYDADISGSGLLDNKIAFKGEDGTQSSNAEISVSGNASALAKARKGKYSITLYEDGTTTPLSNVSFDLMYNGNVMQQAKTDVNGKLTFELLGLRKDYEIIQTSVNDGYHKEDEKIKVHVPTVDLVEEIVYNTPITTNITIQLKNDNKEPIQGGVFEIFDKSDIGFTTPLERITSDENGQIVFTNKRMKEYVIRQVSSVDGYIMSENVYVEVDKYGIVKVKDVDGNKIDHVTNNLKNDYGYLHIVIEDDTKHPIKGANITIKDETGKEVQFQSDQDGNIIIGPLKFGAYTIVQNSTSNGYEIFEAITFTLSSSKENVILVNNKIKPQEPVVPEDKPNPTPKPDDKKPIEGDCVKVETSDTTNATLFMKSLLISGIMLLLITCLKMRYRKNM